MPHIVLHRNGQKIRALSWVILFGDLPISVHTTLDKSSVDALDIIVGITPHYGFLSKKGCDYIDKKLSDNIGKISANLNPLQSFLELFYITLKEICENKLKL